jgi:hypothetical protein
MLKISDDTKGALFSSAVGLIYLAEALNLDFGSTHMPQEGFVPVLTGSALLLCCAALLLRELFFAGAPAGPLHAAAQENGEEDVFFWKRPLRLIGFFVLYPLLLPYVGFITATTLLLYFVFRIFEYRNHIWSLAVAALCVAAAYGIFEKWLKVLIFPDAKIFSSLHFYAFG